MAKSPKNFPNFPKISPHDNFLSTNIICDICDKYELCSLGSWLCSRLLPLIEKRIYRIKCIISFMNGTKAAASSQIYELFRRVQIWEDQDGMFNSFSAKLQVCGSLPMQCQTRKWLLFRECDSPYNSGAILNQSYSQSGLFSIGSFLNWSDSQWELFSIGSFLNWSNFDQPLRNRLCWGVQTKNWNSNFL